MSKINRVFLEGWVAKDAKVSDEDGNYKAMIVVNVIAANRNTGTADKITPKAAVIVAAYNPKDGEQLENLKENDIVSVKGTIVTRPVMKKKICPACGNISEVPGQICYVSPIGVRKIGSAPDAQTAYEHLKNTNVKEVSNEVYIVGNLCTEPTKIESLTTITAVKYQLAVPRNYRLLESLNEDTDYPWIKSFGKKAEEQLEKLMVGSQVLVNGHLNPRFYRGETECANCGNTFEYEDKTLEIVPYEVEYLRHYKEKGGAAGYIAE